MISLPLIANDWLLTGWILLAPLTALLLLFTPAPYGKFSSVQLPLMGPAVHGKWGWFIQESISPLALCLTFYITIPTGLTITTQQLLFLTLWTLHYVNRSIIYPLRTPSMNESRLSVVIMAIGFNIVNGYLNGRQLASSLFLRTNSDPIWWVGLVIFFAGWLINVHSDELLMDLRRKTYSLARKKNDGSNGGVKRYSIPRGGLFEWVSCANYFGEILEWTGFALATGMPAAWSFALWTAANLIPRALSSHRWYKKQFGRSYPANRKAIIPFIL